MADFESFKTSARYRTSCSFAFPSMAGAASRTTHSPDNIDPVDPLIRLHFQIEQHGSRDRLVAKVINSGKKRPNSLETPHNRRAIHGRPHPSGSQSGHVLTNQPGFCRSLDARIIQQPVSFDQNGGNCPDRLGSHRSSLLQHRIDPLRIFVELPVGVSVEGSGQGNDHNRDR